MKSFLKISRKSLVSLGGAGLVILAGGLSITARGSLPSWIRNVEARTELEAVFFRKMALPGGDVQFRRPPGETRAALSELIKQKPKDSELFSLRALEDEQQLDFVAAESDWKMHAANAGGKGAAQLALADFYHRRLRPQDEINALSVIAAGPSDGSEKFTPVGEQRSWRVFERIFGIIHAQGLGKEAYVAQYRAWIARYPEEQGLYGRYLEYLVSQKEYAAANELIGNYGKKFPGDDIFVIKAEALVEYRQGSLPQGLAVYEKSFQPLWAPELVKSYFDLLAQTHSLRKYLDEARAALNKNPEDLTATARIFYYYQQQGKLDAAEQAITNYRLHKEASKSAWTPQEIYVCARLSEDIHVYPEAARYYFALYNSKGMSDAQEKAISGLTDLLLTAPETPMRIGAGELSIYKDIATLDQGPGYLNGILSLILNTTDPAFAFPEEEQRAVAYFHRSRAAELLEMLDAKFPGAPQRPELHVKLLEFYSSKGESAAVLKGGNEFLAAFPKAAKRTQVALLMAEADARLNKTQDEFAIYDTVLKELAEEAERVPLGARVSGANDFGPSQEGRFGQGGDEEGEGVLQSETVGARTTERNAAFQVNSAPVPTQVEARSPEYARVLEQYLARLVELKKIPEALGVLRREIDHNPDDPGLYERLANFLDQNKMGTEQEDVYRRAIARFSDRSWYQRLARYYLSRRREDDYEKLSEDVVKIFKGSELESYFQAGVYGNAYVYLRLNQYANTRFPHNPVFVRNLLMAYHSRATWDEEAWEKMLREHWFEESDLRNQFFEFLSRTGKLETELSSLRLENTATEKSDWKQYVRDNPAAGDFVTEGNLWRSHFEESAPILKALAEEYPAELELDRKASSVLRSLAYFDAAKTGEAVTIEEKLLAANPGSAEILARIGDIYSDRELFAEAAPYWERIPKVAPGESGGYLGAATIYWDYFDFDNALRLLGEGRKKLGDETLYGYEAGAIYESKREYARAIHEYAQAAVVAAGESPAANRLLDLARRPKFRELADQETAKLVVSTNSSWPSITLRVRVLEAQNSKDELTTFLDAVVSGATTIELAEQIETLAQQKSLEEVRQRALEKEAALATDPVGRLQVRYALVHLYESRKDVASAQRNIEALYRENPKIMGVVRSTVDFYWRVKLYPQAIATLLQASKDAYPELGKRFTFEAAGKCTDAGLYAEARELLTQLLKDAPYDGQYLAAMAETYARGEDQNGLKKFYLDQLALFRSAPLSPDDRKTKIATIRRGLIPGLTHLKDYAGAVDQYVELINAFPEDEGLTSKAALYSLRYKRQQQLLDFYSKTTVQSPRDSRWFVVLGRIQTDLENYPAAIDTFGKAIAIRPDRTDLRIARASLDERLMKFDETASEYERIYQLAYKDPKWMEKVAEIRARQGRREDTVAALKIALIGGQPERAANYFEVARRLETWAMMEEARGFAEQGMHVAGNDLLTATENHEGAKLYARIMTRMRQEEKAYAMLQTALLNASAAMPVVREQIARQGIAWVTDKEWRQRTQQVRIENARGGMHDALVEMGTTVDRYFTPEERVQFVQFAKTIRAPMDFADVNAFALPMVQSAELSELEAFWRYDLMMHSPEPSHLLMGQMSRYVELQRQRLKFAELGPELEQFSSRVVVPQTQSVLVAAAEAYRAGGDAENELRILSGLVPEYQSREIQMRFLQLLLAKRPQQLVQMGAAWTAWGEVVADFVVANGDAQLAQAVVDARGRSKPAVWKKSYSALAGLYFNDSSAKINEAFLDALGDETVGDRLGKQVDRGKQLAGDIWYYYGSRYGEYLGATKQGNAEDYLSAALEQSPASAGGYFELADYYMESGNTHAAIADYNHSLELTSGRADVHERLALAYFKQGSRPEAIAQWKQVFSTLSKQINSARAPESFWMDFANACEHLRSRRLFGELRPEADTLLRDYLHKNGNYRSNAPLQSAFVALGNPVAGTKWILELSSSAPDPVSVLTDIADATWIPLAQRAPIYQRILELKINAAAKLEGLEKENAQAEVFTWQVRWARYLVQTKQFAQAGEYLATFSTEMRTAQEANVVPLELQVAAKLGTLDGKIASYRANPQSAPTASVLRSSATQIYKAGDKQSARKLLEYVFAAELDNHNLEAANFLGLAEIRIAAGDVLGAMELLRRLVIVVGEPYQNLDSAAALLEKMGRNGEAIEFLEQLVKASPWEPAYRLRLAKARIASGKDAVAGQEFLKTIVASREVGYRTRVEAAVALRGAHVTTDTGSEELKLLAGDPRGLSTSAADQPFFYDARLLAAQNQTDASSREKLLVKAAADFPARDEARLTVFKMAVTRHEDEFALASIKGMLRDQRVRSVVPNQSGAEEEIISAEEPEPDQDEGESQVYGSTKLLLEQQAQIARAVGEVLVRLNRDGEAQPYLQVAQKLEKTSARRKEIRQELLEVKTRLRRQQINVGRQPILHADLEQDRLVRPRLTASSAILDTASAKAEDHP